MEEGFILDRMFGSVTVARWVSGKPFKDFGLGINTDFTTQGNVATFRCPKCGYLESYASKVEAIT